jgi:deoxyribodipyrimidine photo-lyase
MAQQLYKLSLFIFTRDLRLEDNTSLITALSTSEKVIPIFIFNPVQIDDDKNSYKSNNCVQFMIECLEELDEELRKKASRLFYFYGDNIKILSKIIKETSINAIYINQDYTPFAKKREKDIESICKKNKIAFFKFEDYSLCGISGVRKQDGGLYTVFTPFYRSGLKVKKQEPVNNNYKNYISKSFKLDCEYKKNIHDFYEENKNILVSGGRKNALKILSNIKNFKNYNKDREIPSIHGTTYLSAYLKFNVVSIREVYKKLTDTFNLTNKLITQMYWRDFYMQIMYHHNVIRSPFREKYKDIKWDNNPTLIKKWKEGNTGIPIIDASMRQMNQCGWMHNRSRMIVSNFFVKIMRCDWMIGEKYFAQQLVDYDPANNNGGWQWSASTGTDSQPYFRVFNPWRQAENYDPDCEYIKKYVPELKDIDNRIILNWNELYSDNKNIDYPKPMILDIAGEFKKTLKIYK